MITALYVFILTSAVALCFGFIFRPRRRGTKRKGALGVSVIGLFVIALILIGISVSGMRRDLRILGWPMVEGEVISSGVAGIRAFHPEIVYRYAVYCIEYIDTTDARSPGFGGKTNRLDVAEKIAAKYQSGARIDVYFDPENPRHSYIKRGISHGVYLQLALGIILYAAAVFLLVQHLRKAGR